MSFRRLGYYRSPEQLSRMEDGDWVALLDQLLALKNAEAFSAICDVFSFWPAGHERSRQLDLSLQRMEGWDDRLRTTSSAYMGLYEGGRLSDVARLARSIEIYRREDRGSSELLAIATSEYVSELVNLSIVASELSGFAWKALAESRNLHSLRRLVLQSSTLGQGDIRELLQSKGLPGLQILELIAMDLGAQELSPVRSEIPFPKLEGIDFSHNVLGTEGVMLLADAPWLVHVRWLAIRDNFISRAGIEALIQSPFARELATIDVRDNNISVEDKGILNALAQRKRIELMV
ncbi:MAG: hypothetical protein ACRDRA_10140 [Pseudonocardiaceae bacterium]